MGKMRPLKLETLWVVPGDLSGRRGADVLCSLPPTGWVAIACVAGLLIGAAVGWQRGKMMHIHVDPETACAQPEGVAGRRCSSSIALIVVRKRRAKPCFGPGERSVQSGDADRSADRLRARPVHAAARRDVPARQAAARGGARPRLMRRARAFTKRRPAGARRSAPAALRNREPIAEVLADWLPDERPGARNRQRHRASMPSYFAERFPDARVAAERRSSRCAGLDRRLAGAERPAQPARRRSRSTRRRRTGRSTAPTPCSASTWSTSARGRRRSACSTARRGCCPAARR